MKWMGRIKRSHLRYAAMVWPLITGWTFISIPNDNPSLVIPIMMPLLGFNLLLWYLLLKKI